jgi:tetratricopeptide (TPR) repeat protein
LLESIGIETAFITIPEHMLVAFSIDMGPQNARRVFVNPDELIFRDGKTWVPVEVTVLQTGFMNSWQTGAKEWREAVSGNKEGFISTHAAWKLYEPVGLPGDPGQLKLPVLDDVFKAYETEVKKYLDSTVSPQAERIQAEIERSGGAPETLNRLGVLYARHGMLTEARNAFERALAADRGYVPALINMGNVYYARDDMDRALEYYERVYEKEPDNTRVILNIARVNHSLENYGIVKQYYDRLVSADPALASQFSYLLLRGEEAKRGAEVVEMRSFVIWAEKLK